jgi:hypothetical protein
MPETVETDSGVGAARPASHQNVSSELAGYWESAAQETRQAEAKPGSPPVLFTPLFRTLSDSKLQKTKHSTLIHCRLEAPCTLRSAVEEEGFKTFPKGTMFGIWAKPGMRELMNLSGTEVWMSNAGFKDVGKESDMALYDIAAAAPDKGTKLRVKEDRRVHSLPDSQREKRAEVAEDDDIPF